MKLWLDDIRVPPEGWVWVKTASEAIEALKTLDWDEVSLDHDLAEEHYTADYEYTERPANWEKTGYDVVLWMAENNVWPPIVRVHSMNPAGVQAMRQLIWRHVPERLQPAIPYNYEIL